MRLPCRSLRAYESSPTSDSGSVCPRISCPNASLLTARKRTHRLAELPCGERRPTSFHLLCSINDFTLFFLLRTNELPGAVTPSDRLNGASSMLILTVPLFFRRHRYRNCPVKYDYVHSFLKRTLQQYYSNLLNYPSAITAAKRGFDPEIK